MRRFSLLLALLLLSVASRAEAYPATYAVNYVYQQNHCTGNLGPYSTLAQACEAGRLPGLGSFFGGCYTPGWSAVLTSMPPTGGIPHYYCRGDIYYNGWPYFPDAMLGAVDARPRYQCSYGGVLSGGTCTCAAWETDTGTGCVRTGGTCPTYPTDTTTGCNKTTADMYATMPAPSDLKYGFHNAQACVSKASCNARCQMDNCKWLEVLLPMHTGWYLRFEREWPNKLSECEYMRQTMNPLAEVWCTGKMGRYHIQQDLLDALVEHGCGTRSDWDLVFNAALAACPTAGNPATQFVSQGLIYDWREEARAKCLARRQALGRPDVLIEEPLRGQTCGQ